MKYEKDCLDNLDNIDDEMLLHLDYLDLELPYEQRIEPYIKDNINPHIFISHGLKVMTIYKDTNTTISDLLTTYFSNLK